MVLLRNIRAHKTFVLVSCCLAVFTDVFFYGVLPPILPYVLPERAGVARDQCKMMSLLRSLGAPDTVS